MASDASLTSCLLVPLDGSPLADHALLYALALTTPETEVVLVQVVPEPEARRDAGGHMVAPVDTVFAAEVTTATAALDHIAATWGITPDRVRVEAPVGDPATSILQVASARHCSLIVMASHGRGALGRWRFGSVADRLARSATVPILIVRPGDTPLDPGTTARIKRLIVPLDGSALAERALPVAGELARQLHLPVSLVRVLTAPRLTDMPVASPAQVGVPVIPINSVRGEAESQEAKSVWQYLEQAANHSALSGVKAEPDMLEGEVAHRLLELVTSEDLVVLTSRGRGAVPRWLLGSVAEKLVRLAAAPVVLVPARSAEVHT